VKTTDELWGELEELGEDEVIRRLNDNVWGPENAPRVLAWLRQKEAQRAEEGERYQRVVDSEPLRLAKEANEISADANRLAVRANFIAWLALTVAVLAAIVALSQC
jgi:hypothetical protein